MTSSHPPDVGVGDEPSKNAYFDSPKFISDRERLFETIRDDPQQVADTLQALHQMNDPQRIPFAQSLSVFAATRKQRSSRPIDTFYNTGLLVVLVNILSQRESYVMEATSKVHIVAVSNLASNAHALLLPCRIIPPKFNTPSG